MVVASAQFLTTAVVRVSLSSPIRNRSYEININRNKNYRKNADDNTQPASGQHPDCVSDATTRGLEALPPCVSSGCSIFDGGNCMDIIPSIASEITQKKTERDKSRGMTKKIISIHEHVNTGTMKATKGMKRN